MKKICFLLVVFSLIGALSCTAPVPAADPSQLQNPAEKPMSEPDFPIEADVRNPAVKGVRIPFKRLESGGVFVCSENGLGTMVLIRSTAELEAVKSSNVLAFAGEAERKAFYTLLSQKDLDVYQILIIGTPRNYNSGACFGDRVADELIIAENTGLPTAVYSCEHTAHESASGGLDAMPDRQQDVTVLLTRKTDLDLSAYEGYIHRGPNKYLCYNGIPNAAPLYGTW